MDRSISAISLSGELDVERRAEIAAALAITGNEAGVLLDFSGVTYADSTSLAELLRLRNEAARLGIPIALVIATKQFARLIEYAGLKHAFAIFDSRGAALSELARTLQT